MAEIGIGTLYDFNKAAVAKIPKMNKILINKKTNELNQLFNNKTNKYYMLLCNELKYYTLFNFNSLAPDNAAAAQDVIECLENCGNILAIDKVKNDNSTYEMWIKCDSDNEIHCFYLFPYDKGVLEY
jgi:hypothetical protein